MGHMIGFVTEKYILYSAVPYSTSVWYTVQRKLIFASSRGRCWIFLRRGEIGPRICGGPCAVCCSVLYETVPVRLSAGSEVIVLFHDSAA